MTTPPQHLEAVERALSKEPSRRDDGPAVLGRLQRLCRAAAKDLPASGVGVSVLSLSGDILTAASSDPTSVILEELQFTLGEGPCMSAFSSRLPVLVPDLVGADVSWSAYADAAVSRGVHGVFAFPLLAGSARLGALDVYRRQPGELTSWTVVRAITYAEVATRVVLEAEEGGDGLTNLLTDGSETRFEVYQAQGMAMIQLAVPADEALLRIRAHAFVEGRRIADVASDILARRLFLERDAHERPIPAPEDGDPSNPQEPV